MHLYLMRHGPAEDGAPGLPDAERALTPEGRRLVGRVAAVLGRLALPVEQVLTSPRRRARETASAVADALRVPVHVAPALHGGAGLADLAEVAAPYAGQGLLVVGHQPDLGLLVHALTGARTALSPGALAAIEAPALAAGRGVLLGLFDPHVLARLAPSPTP